MQIMNPGYHGKGQLTVKGTKPPKRRFNIGDLFEFDDTIWRLRFMYRLADEPGVWYHALEEVNGSDDTNHIFEMIEGHTPLIVYEAFTSESDADNFFSNLYYYGDRVIKTTQEMLNVQRVLRV